MKHLDLFSGIGGFALAASWVWGDQHEIHSFVEIDPYCQKILKKHWPKTPIHEDIRTYKHDGTNIDILTGGFPCQPFSQAGRRDGREDNRYLWPAMSGVIEAVRPRWVIGENVFNLLNIEAGMVFNQVCSDLESAGYEVWPVCVPAIAVDAPHIRKRVWIVAHSEKQSKRAGLCKNRPGKKRRNGSGHSSKYMADTTRHGSETGNPDQETGKEGYPDKLIDGSKYMADTGSNQNGHGYLGEGQVFRSAVKKNEGKRQAIQKTELWPVEPNVGRVAHGVPRRVDRLRGLGGAIVPQCVVPIMQTIKILDKNSIA